jgi:hypothetical protein
MSKTSGYILTATALALSALSPSQSKADEESTAQFHINDSLYYRKGLKVPEPQTERQRSPSKGSVALSQEKQRVADAVARATRNKVGESYVDDVLRLTKLESGFTCHVLGPRTRHGRAVGPLQVMPRSGEALGVSTKDLHASCDAQIEAGLRHIEKCISVGATAYKQLAACHVAGWDNWDRTLNRKSAEYRERYIRMAMAVPSQKGLR